MKNCLPMARNPIIVYGITLFLVLLFSSTQASAQQWSAPVTMPSASFVTFSWRNAAAGSGHILEWLFTNTSDTTLECSYSMTTNLGETLEGRMILRPRKQKRSGWKVQGQFITDVMIDTTVARVRTSR